MSEANTPARPTIPTEATDLVSLRELEQRLESLHKLFDERTRYEREILSTRENSIKEALKIADIETKRRLDELNHAHAEARRNWETSLPREMFDAWRGEFGQWRDSVNSQLTTMTQMPSTLAGFGARLSKVEDALQQANGALVMIRFMGFAGVLALLLGLARLAGMLQPTTP